ncbi:MAG: alpha/beta fold hydrolase [Lautropia sp.]
MPYLSVAGVRTYYEDQPAQQAGPREPLLMIHGASADTLAWQDNIGHFARTRRVIAIDLPGHGKSALVDGRPTQATEEFAQHLSSFIEVLQPGPVLLVGHSMGAAISITCAIEHPQSVAGVVAVCGGAAFRGAAGVGFQGDLLRNVAVNPTDWLETTFHSVLGRSTSDARRREMAFDATRASPYVAFADLLTYTSFDFNATMPRLTRPVHWIVGEDDWSTSPAMARDTSARLVAMGLASSVTELAGVGHIPHWEQPAVFNHALEIVLEKFPCRG